MPHDTSFLTREVVHYIPDVHKPHDPALCGLRWINGSDKVTDVTCPMCKEKLQEVKK